MFVALFCLFLPATPGSRVLCLPFYTSVRCHPRHSDIIGLRCSLGTSVFKRLLGNSNGKARWRNTALKGVHICSIPLVPWGRKGPVLPDLIFLFTKNEQSVWFTMWHVLTQNCLSFSTIDRPLGAQCWVGALQPICLEWSWRVQHCPVGSWLD